MSQRCKHRRARAVSNWWPGRILGELESLAGSHAAGGLHAVLAGADRHRGLRGQCVPLLNPLARGRRDAAGRGRDRHHRAHRV